jgi:hypothetical protein
VFDAVSIEYAFAYLLEKPIGGRGGGHDADVFRAGRYTALGELLEAFARHFATRVDRIPFAPVELQNGGAKARLDVAVKSLADAGAELKKRKGREPEDFHWEIIGDLVAGLAALLDHIEGKGAPRA